jgi:hypothetical protein
VEAQKQDGAIYVDTHALLCQILTVVYCTVRGNALTSIVEQDVAIDLLSSGRWKAPEKEKPLGSCHMFIVIKVLLLAV